MPGGHALRWPSLFRLLSHRAHPNHKSSRSASRTGQLSRAACVLAASFRRWLPNARRNRAGRNSAAGSSPVRRHGVLPAHRQGKGKQLASIRQVSGLLPRLAQAKPTRLRPFRHRLVRLHQAARPALGARRMTPTWPIPPRYSTAGRPHMLHPARPLACLIGRFAGLPGRISHSCGSRYARGF